MAELVEEVGREAVLEVLEQGVDEALRPQLVLLVAVPKGKTMDLIVQKAVELGVSVIQPLITERTVVRLGEKGLSKKREKWQRVALEACKQCGQNLLPDVREPAGLAAVLEAEDVIPVFGLGHGADVTRLEGQRRGPELRDPRSATSGGQEA